MPTVDIDGDEASDGLFALVIAVVEILVDALEREAIRRMESESLTDAEIERLGSHLAELEAEIDRLKEEVGVGDDVDRLRGDLDGLVSDALLDLDDSRPGVDSR
ncbi:protein gvpK [Haloprofundus marisrubri]|uniref:Protein gvpK n=1 Tax=Haloprofundus marisrubri TaxID=1514971 RepID=A0A0W1REB5_9EURY|nr:gas vesicle protein K [Haloprofundus marisrubri]KTG10957.1 protein gvpK [Haloprofundus marisrubri]